MTEKSIAARPATFKEPTAGRRLRYKPWEATPLDLSDPKVRKHQEDVERRFQNLILKKRPVAISAAVAEYAHDMLSAFRDQRDSRNISSFMARASEAPTRAMLLPHKDLVLPDESYRAVYDRARRGTASMDELHVVRSVLGMPSIELAKLSFAYGARTEYIQPMHADVAKSLGTLTLQHHRLDVYPLTASHYTAERERRYAAITLQVKDTLGQRDDDGSFVKANNIYICRVGDDSVFSQDVAQVLMKWVSANRQADLDGKEGPSIDVLGRVSPLVRDVADAGAEHPDVVAGVSTVYEYQPSTDTHR